MTVGSGDEQVGLGFLDQPRQLALHLSVAEPGLGRDAGRGQLRGEGLERQLVLAALLVRGLGAEVAARRALRDVQQHQLAALCQRHLAHVVEHSSVGGAELERHRDAPVACAG